MLGVVASASEVRELSIGPSSGSVIFVEQPLLDGQYARKASHSGVMDLSTQSVKWGPLIPAQELTLTFDLVGSSGTPPAAQVRTDGAITTVGSQSGSTTSSEYEEWLLQTYPPNQASALSRSLYFDADRDGLPNYAEFLLQLDTSTFDSVDDLIEYIPIPGGGMELELAHRSGTTFQIWLEEIDLAGGTAPQARGWTSSSTSNDTTTRRLELPERDRFFFRVIVSPF